MWIPTSRKALWDPSLNYNDYTAAATQLASCKMQSSYSRLSQPAIRTFAWIGADLRRLMGRVSTWRSYRLGCRGGEFYTEAQKPALAGNLGDTQRLL